MTNVRSGEADKGSAIGSVTVMAARRIGAQLAPASFGDRHSSRLMDVLAAHLDEKWSVGLGWGRAYRRRVVAEARQEPPLGRR